MILSPKTFPAGASSRALCAIAMALPDTVRNPQPRHRQPKRVSSSLVRLATQYFSNPSIAVRAVIKAITAQAFAVWPAPVQPGNQSRYSRAQFLRSNPTAERFPCFTADASQFINVVNIFADASPGARALGDTAPFRTCRSWSVLLFAMVVATSSKADMLGSLFFRTSPIFVRFCG